MKLSIIWSVFIIFQASKALGDSPNIGGGYHDESNTVFAKQYLWLEAPENFPVQNSTGRFSSYRKTPGITYLHRLSPDWLVGLSLSFKSLRKQPEDREFAFASTANIAQYVIRLYHPFYLLVGGKWLYMLPLQHARFPLVKDPEYEIEFGAAVTSSLIYRPSPKWFFSFRIDRWRGTKTNRFHGFETAIGIARAL